MVTSAFTTHSSLNKSIIGTSVIHRLRTSGESARIAFEVWSTEAERMMIALRQELAVMLFEAVNSPIDDRALAQKRAQLKRLEHLRRQKS